MLSFSDAALQSVLSAASAVPLEQRSEFLQRLAQRAERNRTREAQALALQPVLPEAGASLARIRFPSDGAAANASRSRLCRARQRAGKVVLQIEIDEVALSEFPIDVGLLPTWTDDRAALAQALQRQIENLLIADGNGLRRGIVGSRDNVFE